MRSGSEKKVRSDWPQRAPDIETRSVAETFSGGVEIIERLADEWRALCAEGPCDQPFFRPEWVAAYLRAFAPDRRLLIFTARADGRLRAALPLVEGWRLFHGLPARALRSPTNAHTCRFDLAHGAGEDVQAATQAIWRLLKQRRGWDVIELEDAPQGGAIETLLQAASADGYLTGREEMSPAPYIALPEQGATPEQALAHTTAKFRQNLRRRRRVLEESGKLRLIRTTEADPSELERFYQLEASGWKGREGSAIVCDSRTRRFYDEVARTAAQFGYLSLYRLDCGDRTVAMQYGLTCGERLFLLKSAYDEDWRRGAPGHVMRYEVLRDTLARGIKEYDLLMPQTETKREWATAARPHAICYIFARNLTGLALHAFKFRLKPMARRIKRRLNRNPSETTS